MESDNWSFSMEDFSILTDSSFLKQKRRVSEKIINLLGELESRINLYKNLNFFPGQQLKKSKISKGENYRGLPYFVLDAPAIFNREDIVAFRNIVWWGNEASCSFHISGKFLENHRHTLLKLLPFLTRKEYYISVNDTPWEYHFEPNNYLLLKEIEPGKVIDKVQNDPFIKIAKKLPLTQLAEFPDFAEQVFKEILVIA